MTRIIVVTSGKGGVGKTTVISNLGMSLARLNYKVVLLDADVGLRNLDLVLGIESRIYSTGMDAIYGKSDIKKVVMQDKRQPNFYFFPVCSNQTVQKMKNEDMQQFIQFLNEENDYDFILIDCPAGIEDGFLSATESANEAIIVATPEVTSIRDADKVVGILESNGVEVLSLVVNRTRPRMVQSSNMMTIEDVSGILGLPILGVIPDSDSVIIAANRGEPITTSSADLPLIGKAFDIIAKRLNGDTIDFITFDEDVSPKPKPKTDGLLKKLLKKIIKNDSKVN